MEDHLAAVKPLHRPSLPAVAKPVATSYHRDGIGAALAVHGAEPSGGIPDQIAWAVPMTLSYRPMTIDDIPATLVLRVSTVENRVTMEDLERRYGVTPESLSRSMKSNLKGWACEDTGKLVGFAMGDRSNGEVTVVAVLPGYERRGIGKNLLSRVQSWLFSEGHETIWLCATPDPSIRAYGFYRRLGWRAAGTTADGAELMQLRNGAVGRGLAP